MTIGTLTCDRNLQQGAPGERQAPVRLHRGRCPGSRQEGHWACASGGRDTTRLGASRADSLVVSGDRDTTCLGARRAGNMVVGSLLC